MEKKKKYLLVIGIFIILLSVVGLTYAIWSLTLKQSSENEIISSCFDVVFDEVTKSNIQLNNAYPLTDKEGSSTDPYRFSITNKCEEFAYYRIQIEVKDTTSMDDKYLKVKLNKKGAKILNEYDPSDNYVLEDTSRAYIIETGSLKKKETKNYDLRLWLDENVKLDSANSDGSNIQKSHWKGNITITTGYKEDKFKNSGTLRTVAYNESNGMWSKKANVSKIVIEDELKSKKEEGVDVLGPFDESEKTDGSVMSYLVPDEENEEMYIAYLQGDGGVKANPNCWSTFHGFSHATTIEGLENFDTSNVTSMDHMFSDSGFTSLDLSSFDTSNVISMSFTFGLPNLKELDLSSFDTSKVKNMMAMFTGFGGTKIDLSSFDTSNVTSMQSMFQNAYNLEVLDLSHFDTSQVITMTQMFQVLTNQSHLTKLNLSGFDTSQVNNMSDMFYNLDRIQELNLSNFDTREVQNMSRMFYSMDDLQILDLGENFDTSQVTDMSQMFYNLVNLKKLNLGDQFDTSSLENATSMFYGLSNLEELNLGNLFNTSKVDKMGTMFAFMKKLKKLDLGSQFDTSKVTDMSGMFNGLEELTELHLGDSFNTSSVTLMNLMFFNLKKLGILDLEDQFDTSKVTNMNSMFGNMESLKELDLKEKFNTISVTDMGGMFSGMSALTNLNLGKHFDTQNVDNMHIMFQNLNLSHIDYGDLFVHKEGANIEGMYNNSLNLNRPNDESWKDTEWYSGT